MPYGSMALFLGAYGEQPAAAGVIVRSRARRKGWIGLYVRRSVPCACFVVYTHN
jgi:hypothetical protein